MSASKRILVVTTRYPFPPTGGDKLRIAQLCGILAREYEVHLAALSEAVPVGPPEDACLAGSVVFRQPKLLSWLLCLVGLGGRQPLQLSYYYNLRLRRYVRRSAPEFDAIVFHLARAAQFRPDGFAGRTVLEMTDCMTLHYDRASRYGALRTLRGLLYGLIEKARMGRLERRIAARFDAVSVISEVDRDALVALDPQYRGKIHVFPNYIRPMPYQATGQERSKILFIGNMTALHVLDGVAFFAKEVMPRLIARHPGLCLLVIGAITPRAARRLRRRAAVEVVGPVKHIEEHVDRLLCGVAPLRFASGVQNKVIDYMTLGVPALVSPPALEGIPAQDGEEVLICRSVDDYVAAIDHLLAEPAAWERLAAQGQAFATRTYHREAIADQVLAMFRALLSDQKQPASPSFPCGSPLPARAGAGRPNAA